MTPSSTSTGDRFFADTFYYIALFDLHDQHHERVAEWSQLMAGQARIWTTDAVLLEFANQFSAPRLRSLAAAMIRRLQKAAETIVVPLTSDLLELGLALYEQRPDKEWSLTDCISFVVMREHALVDALTGDQHFEQAGLRALLREPNA
jgi:hypothetical protein